MPSKPPPTPRLTPVSVSSHLRASFTGQLGTIPPVHPSPALQNLTVIITGANSGLGLEAAKQLAGFGCVGRLILACRSAERGEEARRVVLGSVGGAGDEGWCEDKARRTGHGSGSTRKPKIEVWPLDMADLKSVRAFAERCATELDQIDSLVLNAGVDLIEYKKASVENGGYEVTIMVNVVGTMLLATLMVDVIRRVNRQAKGGSGSLTPPRIALVGSAVQFVAKYECLLEADGSGEGILNWLSDEKRWRGKITEERYNLSKGILQMLVGQLARKIDEGEKEGKAPVVLNCSGPGYCRTPLFRDSINFGHRLGLRIIGREPHVGARALTEAAVGTNGGPASHSGYMENGEVRSAHPWFATQQGEEIGRKMWQEVMQVVAKTSPGVVEAL